MKRKATKAKPKENKISTRFENQLEQKYGIFYMEPRKEKPEACFGKCICDKFKYADEECICPKKVFEKRLRPKEMQKKMIAADEKREEQERLEKEKEAKMQKRVLPDDDEEEMPLEDNENID